jgi:hypothetical protein
MSRNYKAEAAWSKQKYRRLEVRLSKEDADKLQRILEHDELSFAEWLRARIHAASGGKEGK